jgi:hypothetical protein
MKFMQDTCRLHGSNKDLPPPPPDDDEEWWLTSARVIAYGSGDMKSLVREWEGLVRSFVGVARASSDIHKHVPGLETQQDRHRELEELRIDAAKLYWEIVKVVTQELQISFPRGSPRPQRQIQRLATELRGSW